MNAQTALDPQARDTETPPGHAAPIEADPADPTLAARVEALVISSGRPLSGVRIAQVLGLLPPDEPAAERPAPSPASEVNVEGSIAATVVAVPRRRKRAAPDAAAALARVAGAVAHLNAEYDRSGRAFRIEGVAGGYRVMTLPAYGSLIAALQGDAARTRLSHEALVTLAIIAYRQPVKRVDLEAIRGVACGEVLKGLLDRKLVTIAGRAEELGRPMLYATTREFLRVFGLASIKDLPTPHELGLKT